MYQVSNEAVCLSLLHCAQYRLWLLVTVFNGAFLSPRWLESTCFLDFFFIFKIHFDVKMKYNFFWTHFKEHWCCRGKLLPPITCGNICPLSLESVTQLCLPQAKAAISVLCGNTKEMLTDSITRKSVHVTVSLSIVFLHLWLESLISSWLNSGWETWQQWILKPAWPTWDPISEKRGVPTSHAYIEGAG